MNHLGDSIYPRHLTTVPLVADLQNYPIGDENPSQFFHDFHDGSKGWKIDKDGTRTATAAELILDANPRLEEKSLTSFVQRWLFFEVLRAVLDVDPWTFVERRNGFWITTQPLKGDDGLISKWLEAEKEAGASPRSYGRIIRAQRVLDAARHYVSTYLAAKSPDDTNSRWPVDRVVALSIMVIGETLTSALIQIQEAIGFSPTGWSNLERHSLGWGYSGTVLENLTQHGRWCKRTVFNLQGLMQSNTVGLLYAISCEPPHKGVLHPQCSTDECAIEKAQRDQWKKPKADCNGHAAGKTRARMSSPNRRQKRRGSKHFKTAAQQAEEDAPEEASNLYHDPTCPKDGTCKPIGPRTDEVNNIVETGKVPLIHYHAGDDFVTLEGTSINKLGSQAYVVFSHVWSDGFGNPKNNRLNKCVLNYFLRLFDASDPCPPFWIDTITVPVKRDDNSEAIKKAIASMHTVYAQAKYTLVLDLSLMKKTRSPDQFLDLAMSITVSNWMRRLWTLQEAYLSQEIRFALSGNDVYSLEDLEKLYRQEGGKPYTCLPETCRAYWDGMLLGTDRVHLQRPGMTKRAIEVDYKFVAAVWRAVQWRSTSFSQHLPLALATLFNLDTGQCSIALILGKLLIYAADPFADTSNTTTEAGYSQEYCDQLMRLLLEQLAALPRCAIPPGFIFLPGPELEIPGFGFAPRTWLSARQIESPDPLSIHYGDARLLHGEGLEVMFPGFRLYQMDALATPLVMTEKEKLSFPSESNILEWYTLEEADTNWFFKTGFESETEGLAVIVPRLPLLNPKEIALLVNIKKEKSNTLFVNILHRVWISRESDADRIKDLQQLFNSRFDGGMLCGEIRPASQKWCVDRKIEESLPPESLNEHAAISSSHRSECTEDSVAPRRFISQKARTATSRVVDALTAGMYTAFRDGFRTFTFKQRVPP